MQKTSRFIRKNAVDRIFVILPILLLVALLARGVTAYFFPARGEDCTAEVSFVIRAVDEELLAELQKNPNPSYTFSVDGKALFTNAFISETVPTVDVVGDGAGGLVEVPTEGRYDVTFTILYAGGVRAKDGAFMIGGVRRLAVGDTVNLTDGTAVYPVDFIKVRINE